MNERIKELLIQSEVFNKDGTVLKDVCGYELNKFAELIVKECSYLADQAHHKATGGKSAGGYIRQHFGVEQ